MAWDPRVATVGALAERPQGDGGEPDPSRTHPSPGEEGEDDDPHRVAAMGGSTDDELAQALQRTIAEGERRLNRSWPSLLATGAVGGLDVATGVFALFLVTADTGDKLLGSLAFGIGFIALTLGKSELFTENFLVPVIARIANRAERRVALLRLWGGTLVTNLIGGWVAMAIVMLAFPRLHETAVTIGEEVVRQGIGGESFAKAMLGGMAITLMTWMERGTESVPAKLVAVVGVAFLLVAGPLNHVIVNSLEMFAALLVGAPFGYLEAARFAAFSALGNIVGGIGLVTVLRLVQLGRAAVAAHAEDEVGEDRRRHGTPRRQGGTP